MFIHMASLQQTSEEVTIIILVSQMRKLKHRVVKSPSPGHSVTGGVRIQTQGVWLQSILVNTIKPSFQSTKYVNHKVGMQCVQRKRSMCVTGKNSPPRQAGAQMIHKEWAWGPHLGAQHRQGWLCIASSHSLCDRPSHSADRHLNQLPPNGAASPWNTNGQLSPWNQ